jgi:hypothetical protein
MKWSPPYKVVGPEAEEHPPLETVTTSSPQPITIPTELFQLLAYSESIKNKITPQVTDFGPNSGKYK